MNAWDVQVIFLVQVFIFILLWVRRDKKYLGFYPQAYILWLILLIAVAIVMSLWYHSTDPLLLYF